MRRIISEKAKYLLSPNGLICAALPAFLAFLWILTSPPEPLVQAFGVVSGYAAALFAGAAGVLGYLWAGLLWALTPLIWFCRVVSTGTVLAWDAFVAAAISIGPFLLMSATIYVFKRNLNKAGILASGRFSDAICGIIGGASYLLALQHVEALRALSYVGGLAHTEANLRTIVSVGSAMTLLIVTVRLDSKIYESAIGPMAAFFGCLFAFAFTFVPIFTTAIAGGDRDPQVRWALEVTQAQTEDFDRAYQILREKIRQSGDKEEHIWLLDQASASLVANDVGEISFSIPTAITNQKNPSVTRCVTDDNGALLVGGIGLELLSIGLSWRACNLAVAQDVTAGEIPQ